MEIRSATLSDAETMRQIYNIEVLTTTVTFDLVERTEAEQHEWILEHQGVYPAVVALDFEKVIGFASLSPYRPRPAYSTTAEDSIYVAQFARGRGVGSALLGEIVERAGSHGFHAIIARIVGDHQASIGLHQRHGFELVGIEREVGRKFGRWLDVALMQRMID
ncbi:MAG TPA: GNAT family N-acetyltransferase [Acidimicrobiales bacterium]|nr:GNAT family N-acetyltransferase [Acidimicrobiales bacterium]